MIRHLAYAFAAISASTAAHAEAPENVVSARVELWNGLHVGMSRKEVAARHPEAKIILGASCRAQFKPVFQYGELRAVRIVQYLDHNDCGREVYAALMRKYGVPAGHDSAGYLDLSGFGNSYDFYWYHEGRAIKLRLLQSGRFGELSYALDPAAGAEIEF